MERAARKEQQKGGDVGVCLSTCVRESACDCVSPGLTEGATVRSRVKVT